MLRLLPQTVAIVKQGQQLAKSWHPSLPARLRGTFRADWGLERQWVCEGLAGFGMLRVRSV